MLFSFSLFNSKGCRLYHLQVKGSEKKELLGLVISNAILAKEKVISPLRWKGVAGYFCFVGGCWCVIITDEGITTDSMMINYAIEAIEEVFPITELSVLKNINLLESIIRDCIGDGILHSIDYFGVLRNVRPPQQVEMIPEMIEVKHPKQKKEFHEGITFGLKQRTWDDHHFNDGLITTQFERVEPSFEKLDRYNTLPAEKRIFQPEIIFLIQREEVTVLFSCNGEIEQSKTRGGFKSTVYSVSAKSIQFSIDSMDLQSFHCTINQRLEGNKDIGVLTWKNPYGTIPLLSYEGGVKTFPVLLKGFTRIDKNSLVVSVNYSLIGKAYLHSFCMNIPSQLKSIQTNSINYTTIDSTLFLYINKRNHTEKCLFFLALQTKNFFELIIVDEGTLLVTLIYDDNTKPLKTDVPFGWVDFECPFSVSAIGIPNINQKSVNEIEVTQQILSKSGTYGINFLEDDY